jgi:hypothetical protein
MAVVLEALTNLLDRAATDPALLTELAADPLEVARRFDVRVTAADVKGLLGLSGATDAELVEVLRARLASNATGCGGCNIET